MEQEDLSLDRHLIHVFVAAIEVEITTAEAGKLERVCCHRRSDASRPSKTLILTIASPGCWTLFGKGKQGEEAGVADRLTQEWGRLLV